MTQSPYYFFDLNVLWVEAKIVPVRVVRVKKILTLKTDGYNVVWIQDCGVNV